MAKILLIDDEADLRRFLQDALEKRGHEVSCLERAEGGLDLLDTGEFDLVLVDENMPGPSGSEFLKVVRKKGRGIPAILMTGLAKAPFIQAMKKLDVLLVGKPLGGADEFLKELEPALADALKCEAEILSSFGRAIDAALRAGKTNLVPRLRKLLDEELLLRALNEANGNPEAASRILGVSLDELTKKDPIKSGSKSQDRSSFQAETLLLIHNHPDWTVAEIAQKLGCSKAKLYRDPIINRVLQGRNTGNYRPPAGRRTADGDVEAFDD